MNVPSFVKCAKLIANCKSRSAQREIRHISTSDKFFLAPVSMLTPKDATFTSLQTQVLRSLLFPLPSSVMLNANPGRYFSQGEYLASPTNSSFTAIVE